MTKITGFKKNVLIAIYKYYEEQDWLGGEDE